MAVTQMCCFRARRTVGPGSRSGGGCSSGSTSTCPSSSTSHRGLPLRPGGGADRPRHRHQLHRLAARHQAGPRLRRLRKLREALGRRAVARGHLAHVRLCDCLGRRPVRLGLATAMLFNRSFAGKAFYRSVWMMPMVGDVGRHQPRVDPLLRQRVRDPQLRPGSPRPFRHRVDHESRVGARLAHHRRESAPHALHDPHPPRGAQSLPQDPFEAARIDGASRWQMLVHITLPLLKTHIMVALILRSIFGVKEFDTILAITEGGPRYASETMTSTSTSTPSSTSTWRGRRRRGCSSSCSFCAYSRSW